MAEASISVGKTTVIITCTKEAKKDYERKLFEIFDLVNKGVKQNEKAKTQAQA